MGQDLKAKLKAQASEQWAKKTKQNKKREQGSREMRGANDG